MPYDTHKGLLKVGDATIKTSTKPDDLVPNCRELNQAAKKRIDDYTKTASVTYRLEYTELAIKTDSGYVFPFRDNDIHNVLMNSGIHKVQPNGKTGDEWFLTDLETVIAAIKAYKSGKNTISSNNVSVKDSQKPIDFREEQIDAINKTLKTFKKDNEMLWYAKMRFGKTLTALEVIRRSQYRKVIIVTHRPVVDDGWSDDFKKVFFPGNSENEYHYERKTKDSAYVFDEKTDAENDSKIKKLVNDGTHFIYFASMQDLRGSEIVGGNFNKNNAVFATDWDLIVIDEAHEGTQTELGDNVIKKLRKENTKVLALSGTPFNLLDKFSEENVYTWDYVMEQKKKSEWDLAHYGDHNPYADLPKMHIYTYDLGDKLRKYVSDEYGTKAFNFREFFRVWYKGPNGNRELPNHAVEGKFVHENDIVSFLNMLVNDSDESGYPYSTQEYRDMFCHTLWMVPGVKEAKALSELLRNSPVFGEFGIANVAGEGDKFEEEHAKDALELVRDTIKNNKYSITLSCGKLTTGVTVKEWTAVLMLSGSYSTAAAQYMQTIFRVQSAGSVDGKQKTDCYVFDFAPDRTLKVLTETVHLSRKPGKSQQKRREAMTEFLNYCPVISIAGSKTKEYSVESMMEQVKQIYAERAVNSGFEDESIYNDELLRLNEIDATKFNELKDIIGASKATKKKKEVIVNGQGLTDEQLEHIDDPLPNIPQSKLSEKEKAEIEKKKQAKQARKKAIDILRGISIRMPLMIYGADVPIDEDIDIDRFVDLVDDNSWKEFMPAGVTKKIFAKFTKYYDRDVFIAAGKRIRRLAAAADKETPTRRVIQIAEIFRHFKNPDKETVLTPWRVVNMHLSETIGGWCFFNEQFEDDTAEEKHRLNEPHFVDRGNVTKEVFDENAHILEINSKSGLYPLYVAYSFYKQRMEGMSDDDWEPEDCQYFWNEVLKNNVYVICKTPMAKAITKRTLSGYTDSEINAHYFDDLTNMLKNKPEQFKKRVLKGSYWKKDVKEMKFDAVVGNPPYQEEGNGDTNAKKSIYNYFIDSSEDLSNRVTLIHPARFLFNAGDTSKEWNSRKLNDTHFRVVKYWSDSSEVFPTVDIKGGVAVTFWDKNAEYTPIKLFTPFSELTSIVNKVVPLTKHSLSSVITNRGTYKYSDFAYDERPEELSKTADKRIAPSSFERMPLLFTEDMPEDGYEYVKMLGNIKNERCYRWFRKDYIAPVDNLEKYKVIVPKANGSGAIGEVLSTPLIGTPLIGYTETYISIGATDSKKEAEATLKYVKTKFARVMLGILKVTQNNPRETWQYVPLQDFTENSDIDWSKSIHEIDLQLYKKYGLSQDEIAFIESKVKPMDDSDDSPYRQLLKVSYNEVVDNLIKKYGAAKHNYFKDTGCTKKNPLVTRTNEGLICHHIDEDKAIMLCNDKFAAKNPFDYQKADRLVYCNLLEHLLLHVKIAENPNETASGNELPGIGGAINFICKDLNDIYSGKEFTDEWRKNVADKVKDNFDDYILILRYLWNVIERNPLYKAIITKDKLCLNWDGKVVKKVMNALNEDK